MTVSGTARIRRNFNFRQIHWIAKLREIATNTWQGKIWYRDGDTNLFPYTAVRVKAYPSLFANQRRVEVVYLGSGRRGLSRTYQFYSSYFHEVEFEYDVVENATDVTSINTCDHPNRPPSLPCENLSIETVFRRAGFDVGTSGASVVPLSLAGANATWSDMEMHDAMQTYWSRFANKAQWAMWVFFAALHDTGSGLGGIMFDDIGANHRQGTAIFSDSFIANAPAGELDPSEWVARMRFWTACHEMGHGFNLAHAWQKSLGIPWIPLVDDTEARSFMNYPYFVTGGEAAFFADFDFRFIDEELLFMRHAPARFVQMGNADWFDNHGFEQANIMLNTSYKLKLRTNREKSIFQFLETPMLELKLTNISGQPQLIAENILRNQSNLTVILKKDNKSARQYAPFARYCWNKADVQILKDDESIYAPLFVAAGVNGWDIAEPGYYTVQVALHCDDEDIVSNPLRIRVAPPRSFEEEFVAQDFFSEDVGRILAMKGSVVLDNGNDVLREVVDRFGDHPVALQARVPLGNVLMREYKTLQVEDAGTELKSVEAVGGSIAVRPAEVDDAKAVLSGALIGQPEQAAVALGHITYKETVDQYSEFLYKHNNQETAVESLDVLHSTLEERKVLKSVLRSIKKQRDDYAEGS